MQHLAGGRFAFAFGHAPAFGGGGDQHLPRGSACLAQRIPVLRGRRAAASMLVSVERRIEVGLLSADLRPIDVQFFGDKHGQHGFDALTNLRVLRHDRHNVVWRNPHVGSDRSGRYLSQIRGRRLGETAEAERQQQRRRPPRLL